MKKIILPLLVLATLPAAAQFRKPWFDFQVGQHVGINKWSGSSYVDKGITKPVFTEFRGVFNYSPNARFPLGLFVDMGLCLSPAPSMREPDLAYMPTPDSRFIGPKPQYYLREKVSSSGADDIVAHLKISTGVFADIPVCHRFHVLPYFGVGGMTMPRHRYECVIKEDGSNMQYKTVYTWGKNNYDDYRYEDPYNLYDDASDYGTDMLGYVVGRLNFACEISHRANLLVGVEATHFFQAMALHSKHTNSFNQTLVQRSTVKGNKMNTIGITLGLSFR